MKNSEAYLELFDKIHVLNEKLDSQERKTALTDRYLLYEKDMLITRERLRKAHLKAKKEYLNNLDSNQTTNNPKTKLVGFSLLSITLVVLAWLILGKKDTVSRFDMYYEEYPMVELTRSASDNTAQILNYYNSGQYALFIDSSKDLELEHKSFYRALSFMKVGKYDDALSELDKLTTLDENKLPINYYKALAELESRQLSKAKESLARVKPKFKYYKQRADLLLSELKEK